MKGKFQKSVYFLLMHPTTLALWQRQVQSQQWCHDLGFIMLTLLNKAHLISITLPAQCEFVSERVIHTHNPHTRCLALSLSGRVAQWDILSPCLYDGRWAVLDLWGVVTWNWAFRGTGSSRAVVVVVAVRAKMEGLGDKEGCRQCGRESQILISESEKTCILRVHLPPQPTVVQRFKQ